jgi:hypothetical protein
MKPLVAFLVPIIIGIVVIASVSSSTESQSFSQLPLGVSQLPEVGDRLSGWKISQPSVETVVLLPDCDSCSAKAIPWKSLRALDQTSTVFLTPDGKRNLLDDHMDSTKMKIFNRSALEVNSKKVVGIEPFLAIIDQEGSVTSVTSLFDAE